MKTQRTVVRWQAVAHNDEVKRDTGNRNWNDMSCDMLLIVIIDCKHDTLYTYGPTKQH